MVVKTGGGSDGSVAVVDGRRTAGWSWGHAHGVAACATIDDKMLRMGELRGWLVLKRWYRADEVADRLIHRILSNR